eukprot:2391918-Rhodomonas_salina.1
MLDARAISAIANLQSEFSSTSQPDVAMGNGRGRPVSQRNACERGRKFAKQQSLLEQWHSWASITEQGDHGLILSDLVSLTGCSNVALA